MNALVVAALASLLLSTPAVNAKGGGRGGTGGGLLGGSTRIGIVYVPNIYFLVIARTYPFRHSPFHSARYDDDLLMIVSFPPATAVVVAFFGSICAWALCKNFGCVDKAKARIARKRAENARKREERNLAQQANHHQDPTAVDLEYGHQMKGAGTPYSVPSTYAGIPMHQTYDNASAVYQPPVQYPYNPQTPPVGTQAYGEAQSYFHQQGQQQQQYGNAPYGQGGLGYTTTGARNDAGAGPYNHN
ncbi:hypothetical protein CPB86DRAFT_792858 [Serendipita vermifera]|nr:hypothetical protein CPB86DRAFT_792858 [Serendipita vermifera]